MFSGHGDMQHAIMRWNEGDALRYQTCVIQEGCDLKNAVAYIYADLLGRQERKIRRFLVLDSDIESSARIGGHELALLEDRTMV